MSAPSSRMLSLLSLLQVRRDWPGQVLAERLGVTPRTVRRDVDRLRELGYAVTAAKGPDGGYRLGAGAQLPPLLFDDDQVVALAIALRGAPALGADLGDAAERALATVRQVMPSRLRHRLEALDVTAAPPGDQLVPVDARVLVAVSEAVHACEVLRFDYASPGAAEPPEDGSRELVPPRRVEPHGVVGVRGRWYLVAWDTDAGDWRVFRLDRMTPRPPARQRFAPRPVPGGSATALLSARFRGSATGEWACTGSATVHLPAADVVPHARDGAVEPLGPDRCRVTIGSWSWTGVAASLARFDADVEALDPSELAEAVAALGRRFSGAG